MIALARAPSTRLDPRKLPGIEAFLDAQRDQLPLWLPVAFGSGIAAWFALPTATHWIAFLTSALALGAAAFVFAPSTRTRRIALIAATAMTLGCGDAWWRADQLAAPVLTRPVVTQVEGKVEGVEVQAAKERVRLSVIPNAGSGLPPRVRVVVDDDKMPGGVSVGDRIAVRARLVGPPTASIPGGYDFSRTAWFQRLGATGKAIGPVARASSGTPGTPGLRERLSTHIRAQVEGSAGGIASAFATGDRGGIAKEDEEAMRASGLTHLLSVSGLHITAVVGAVMFLTLRLLALSPFLARRLNLLAIAAGAGALAAIGYTLLTGAEVPTIRSCVAAVLVVVGLMLGRQAFTLRLVASGALVILILWPEALVGPSFQLSFAAIASIVALHEWTPVKAFFAPHDEGVVGRTLRGVGSLLLTGIAVEVALAPIALYHFHRQGLFGALANIVAIPLTTFVTMPFEALAILFDGIGLGAPFWWVTAASLDVLLWIARTVAAFPGAVAALPTIPVGAFAIMVASGLWLLLWKGQVRAWSLPVFAGGALWALVTPVPDLLITGDGMHLAVRGDDGRFAILRPRAGDYVRSVMVEAFGELGELDDLDVLPGADCSDDVCRVDLRRGSRDWRILGIRSRYLLPPPALRRDCAQADIVVSERRLPDWCRPRWLKADRTMLARTGGLSIDLSAGRVTSVAQAEGAHPWVLARRADKVASPRHERRSLPLPRLDALPRTSHEPWSRASIKLGR